jgi:hypothetical protein
MPLSLPDAKSNLAQFLKATWIPVAAIYLFALILRVVFIVHSQDVPEYKTFIPAIDADMFWRAAKIALSPAEGLPNWELLSTTSGFFVWFLTVVQRLGIDSIFSYRILSAFITSMNPVLIFLITRNGTKLKTAGYLAAAIFAVSPSALHFDTLVSKTNLEIGLYLFVVLLIFQLLESDPKARRIYCALGLGSCLAMLALLQKAALLAAVVTIVVIALRGRPSFRERLTIISLVCCGLFSVLMLFNKIVLHDFKTNPVDGYNLYLSLNPNSDGLYLPADDIPTNLLGHSFFSRLAAERHTGRRMSFDEANIFYREKALQNVKDHAGKIALITIKKIRLLLNNAENRGEEYFLHLKNDLTMFSYNPITFGLLLIFAPFGIVYFFREKKHNALLAISVPLLTSIAICLILFPMWRYRYAVTPAMSVLAATGLVYLCTTFRKESMTFIISCFLLTGLWTYSIFRPIHSEEYLQRSMTIAKENRQLTIKRAATTKVMGEIGSAYPGSTMQRDLTVAKCETSLYSDCIADVTSYIEKDRSHQTSNHYYVDSLLMLGQYEPAAKFFETLRTENPGLVAAMTEKYKSSPLINHALETYVLKKD